MLPRLMFALRAVFCCLIWPGGLLLATALPVQAQGGSTLLLPPQFTEAVAQGFGDRHNSYIWSMVWWQGHLYVGTGRSTQCVLSATSHLYYPNLTPYPPLDPDVACTDSPQDLPLQAEIWRWTPEGDTWQRVFQSPNDILIRDAPGSFIPPNSYVARDTGFRSMLVFTETDGTEALYVGGVSSNSFNPNVPPPRLLRSTDGLNFEPVPQDSGTFLGDLPTTSFRAMTAYQNKLFVVATRGYAGFGPVLVSENPQWGNDSFRYALPSEINAFELATFGGALYIGTGDSQLAWPPGDEVPPYRVLKTRARGEPPYDFSTVVPFGGGRSNGPSYSVVSMQVFNDALFVGTDRPAELIRIHADDSWDLIAGQARWSDQRWKPPLSGLGDGLGNNFNIHIWRMHVYRDQLFIGTMDQSTRWRSTPLLGPLVADVMGFDLYITADGETLTPMTTTGFGDPFDVGVRNFVTTPYGLFFGTANHYYGGKIWRETLPGTAGRVYLPLILTAGDTL